MARRAVEPSTMSLLGLVRHLADVERETLRVMMAGQDVPRLFCSDTDRDGDFDGAVPDPLVGSGNRLAERLAPDAAGVVVPPGHRVAIQRALRAEDDLLTIDHRGRADRAPRDEDRHSADPVDNHLA